MCIYIWVVFLYYSCISIIVFWTSVCLHPFSSNCKPTAVIRNIMCGRVHPCSWHVFYIFMTCLLNWLWYSTSREALLKSRIIKYVSHLRELAFTVSLEPSEWKAFTTCRITLFISYINEGLLLAVWELNHKNWCLAVG